MCADAPPTETFEELQHLAQDRDAWSKHWELIAPTDVNPLQFAAPDTADIPTTTTRDTNTPTTTAHTITSAKRKKKKRKRKPKRKLFPKDKPTPWTNAQRQAWARAHYLQHHGKVNVNWQDMVAEANAATAAPPKDESLWAEPCVPPSPTPPNSPITSTDICDQTTELWAEPCVPPSPTPPNTPTTPEDNILRADPRVPPSPTPPDTPTTTDYPQTTPGPTTTTHPTSSRDSTWNAPPPTTTSHPKTKLDKLKRMWRNRFKRKPAQAPPQHCKPCGPTPSPLSISLSPCKECQPPTPIEHSIYLSPIIPNSQFSPLISPDLTTINTPNPPTKLTSTANLMNETMNETLNETYMNDSKLSLPDHSNFLNETQKHILYLNGSYIHISYD